MRRPLAPHSLPGSRFAFRLAWSVPGQGLNKNMINGYKSGGFEVSLSQLPPGSLTVPPWHPWTGAIPCRKVLCRPHSCIQAGASLGGPGHWVAQHEVGGKLDSIVCVSQLGLNTILQVSSRTDPSHPIFRASISKSSAITNPQHNNLTSTSLPSPKGAMALSPGQPCPEAQSYPHVRCCPRSKPQVHPHLQTQHCLQRGVISCPSLPGMRRFPWMWDFQF